MSFPELPDLDEIEEPASQIAKGVQELRFGSESVEPGAFTLGRRPPATGGENDGTASGATNELQPKAGLAPPESPKTGLDPPESPKTASPVARSPATESPGSPGSPAHGTVSGSIRDGTPAGDSTTTESNIWPGKPGLFDGEVVKDKKQQGVKSKPPPKLDGEVIKGKKRQGAKSEPPSKKKKTLGE
jgi:hypothetical protein